MARIKTSTKVVLVSRFDSAYRCFMAEPQKFDFSNSVDILREEDAATLAILEQRMRAADEGRLVSPAEARQRIQEWLTRSSIQKTR
jgi:hypothetical protein